MTKPSECAPSEDSDQPGLRCPHEERLVHADSEDSDQTGRMLRLI